MAWKAPDRPAGRITQTFNDGIVKVYEVTDVSHPGDRPVKKLVLKETLRYDQRTVGMNRFYTAMQENVQIDNMVRCPRRAAVSTQDIAEIGGVQYEIDMVQYPTDVYPPAMDLTLSRLEQKYEYQTD